MTVPEIPPETPRSLARFAMRQALAEAGIDSADLDARVLLTEALGVSAMTLVTEATAPLTAAEARRATTFLARRLSGEPVARILGSREFWGLPFRLGPGTLVPRPDSETLVSSVLAAIGDDASRAAPLSVLDLGTGSGCLLVALLSELPNAIGCGVDRAADALAVARFNARVNAVGDRAQFVEGHWTDGLTGPFDIVVSNPPYIESAAIAGLAPEVREHDPLLALDGGPDGLDAYRAIIAELPRILKTGGLVAFEIGASQGTAVTALLETAGFRAGPAVRDLGGHERVILARHR